VNVYDPLPPVLIVDDSVDDVFFLRRSLVKAGLKNRTVHFEDGSDVLVFLKGICASTTDDGRVVPALGFIDIRMPCVGGFEVLEWVRHQPILQTMKWVVVSTSSLPADVECARALGAFEYLVKYPDTARLSELLARALPANSTTDHVAAESLQSNGTVVQQSAE
jgi:CheY-like chemotaxis protein